MATTTTTTTTTTMTLSVATTSKQAYPTPPTTLPSLAVLRQLFPAEKPTQAEEKVQSQPSPHEALYALRDTIATCFDGAHPAFSILNELRQISSIAALKYSPGAEQEDGSWMAHVTIRILDGSVLWGLATAESKKAAKSGAASDVLRQIFNLRNEMSEVRVLDAPSRLVVKFMRKHWHR